MSKAQESTFTGAHIEGDELKSLLDHIQSTDRYKKLIESMQKVQGFDENNVSVRIAYKMKSRETLKDSPTLVRSKFVQLLFDNKTAEIFYTLIQSDEEDKDKEGFIGSVVHENRTKITTLSNLKNEKDIETSTESYEGQYDESIVGEYPNDPNYNHDDVDEVMSLDAFDACMPSPSDGWYNHCGKGCGDGLSYGGGTPINKVDYCCRAHDRCWARFGQWDCECDSILIECTRVHRYSYPAAWVTIYNVFFWNTIGC